MYSTSLSILGQYTSTCGGIATKADTALANENCQVALERQIRLGKTRPIWAKSGLSGIPEARTVTFVVAATHSRQNDEFIVFRASRDSRSRSGSDGRVLQVLIGGQWVVAIQIFPGASL